MDKQEFLQKVKDLGDEVATGSDTDAAQAANSVLFAVHISAAGLDEEFIEHTRCLMNRAVAEELTDDFPGSVGAGES